MSSNGPVDRDARAAAAVLPAIQRLPHGQEEEWRTRLQSEIIGAERHDHPRADLRAEKNGKLLADVRGHVVREPQDLEAALARLVRKLRDGGDDLWGVTLTIVPTQNAFDPAGNSKPPSMLPL